MFCHTLFAGWLSSHYQTLFTLVGFFGKKKIQNNYPVVLQSFQIHDFCPFVLTPKLLVVGNNLSPPAVLCFPELCTFPAVLYSVILPDLMTCSFPCYPFSVLQLCQILSSANHLLLLAVQNKSDKILKNKDYGTSFATFECSNLRNNEDKKHKQPTCFCNCVIFSFEICECWLIFFKSSIWSLSVDTKEKLHH